ncbi:hypothetical protein FN846DRAFT_896066 [Sphaerosporella brunnea]|uniref:Uncharacterized protein n=1 Tax=Sphaerosporella brunnea TaxID=1250544 RepID=A0A5J5EEE9_9PEZI|nr:hypothetical protein FN846DRAFT_896066 [Sphaerosporella brunnea]
MAATHDCPSIDGSGETSSATQAADSPTDSPIQTTHSQPQSQSPIAMATTTTKTPQALRTKATKAMKTKSAARSRPKPTTVFFFRCVPRKWRRMAAFVEPAGEIAPIAKGKENKGAEVEEEGQDGDDDEEIWKK